MLNVIIPHHGSEDILERCWDATVTATESIDSRIAVCDSAGRLFTATANDGISNALSADYIWLLNNDAIPDKLCAVAAIAMLDAHPEIGMVGSQNRSIDNHDVATWAGSGDYFPAGRHMVGPVESFTFSRELWIPFSSVFLRGSMVRELGLLDKQLKHICSDADYCIRARCAGWQLWHNPDSIVYHDFGSSSAPPDHIAVQMHKDSATFETKHSNHVRGEHSAGR